MLRCAQYDRAVLYCCAMVMRMRSASCHPERSEGSVSMGVEMLRFAQHDIAVLLPRHCIAIAFR